MNWMMSADGQAVATWMSSILSVVAIAIALMVALIEQKRANAERLADSRREHEERVRQELDLRKKRISKLDV